MRQYPHLLNRNGHYYFRMAVPSSLRSSLGQRELFYSLKTKNYLEARTRSVALLQVAEDVFKEKNTPCLASYLKERLREIAFLKKPLQSLQEILPSNSFPVPTTQKSFTWIYQAYLAECAGDRKKTIDKRKSVLSIWLEIMGDGPITSITKDKARHFKNVLMRLPANMKQRYGQRLIKDIDLDSIHVDQLLSVKTINDKLVWMSAFINWSIKNGYYDTANPFSGLALKQADTLKNKRNPFSQKQLEMIFSAPPFKDYKSFKQGEKCEVGNTALNDGFYWIPLIALYSGARLQEICQLYISDIAQVGNIWVFDFNEDGKDKRLKTSSSKRKTPVHPKLIELGLLDHLTTQHYKGEQRLFPDTPLARDGTYSSTFSKRFNYFLNRFGIKTGQTSFHSFRHNFIDNLRNTNVHREVREALVGHLDKKSAHDMYGSRIGLQRLYEGIVQLEYPNIPCFNENTKF